MMIDIESEFCVPHVNLLRISFALNDERLDFGMNFVALYSDYILSGCLITAAASNAK